ncbi:MAG TPA: hypothetical protein P5543_09905 [Planctomycetota bacterium]|nr:hypothetical protein [Planctomycetota bacterium]
MSVWEKVFKNPKSKGVVALGSGSLSVPGVKAPGRSGQFPNLVLGLALGTTFTKRTFLCQVGAEMARYKPENENGKNEIAVFRAEKVIHDQRQEISLGEEALSNFMSDRSDPACTLFLQPIRYLLGGAGKPPPYISTYAGEKIIHQSPTNEELYKIYIKAQLKFLYNAAKIHHSANTRFQLSQMVVEYPDYFATPDIKRYKKLVKESIEEFFPPMLTDEEQGDIYDKLTFLPESFITMLHWLTDQVDPKLAIQDIEIKKLMAKHGILPRITAPVNFLVVTQGATHSRVVRLQFSSFEQLISAKRVGETVSVGHNYLGRTGFGGDHISCAFLEEEAQQRYGATAANKVNSLSRKVLEDWSRMTNAEGKKHFEELLGNEYQKAMEKLAELTLKGFGENPENTMILLGGKVFEIPYFREHFKNLLRSYRIPQARIITPSAEECSVERACEILQFQQKGLGRSFTIRFGADTEGSQKFTWRIGKVVEGTLVDVILSPDDQEWDSQNPRTFTLTFEQGVRRMNLGYQKSLSGLSQLWANINLKPRIKSAVTVTCQTDGPDDLRITEVKTNDPETTITKDDFQIDMLIAGEHPSFFPLYDKILKS